MSDGSQFIDIVLFAMVAIFLGLRLRSVLGKRTGNEQPPRNFRGGVPPRADQGKDDKVIDVEPNRRPPADAPAPGSLAARIANVRAQDPSFSENQFESGAKAAFEMIVRAFARDDEETLRPLLSDEVFHNFSGAIQARRKAGEMCENQLLQVVSTDIVDANVEGTIARVTVKYISEQIIAVKNAEGAVIEGDPSHQVEIVDVWTYARDTRSRDPNWLLVATSSPDA